MKPGSVAIVAADAQRRPGHVIGARIETLQLLNALHHFAVAPVT